MPPKTKLSAKQRKFAEVYDGNGTAAARAAGYSGTDASLAAMASTLLRNPKVKALVRSREEREVRPAVATRQQRQEFWSAVMAGLEGADEDIYARLKASELLGRSEADFKDKVEHSGSLTLEQLMLAASAPTTQPLPTGAAAPTSPSSSPSGERDGSGSVSPEPVRSFTAVCSECGESFQLTGEPEGDAVVCPKCGSTKLREQDRLPFMSEES